MKIALIDDDRQETEYLSELIGQHISELGFTINNIDSFCSGEEFLLAWEPQMYDLILLDIYMEGMDGIETARAIREEDGEVPLVFCTFSNEFASQSYEVCAQYYLQKPISDQKVVNMLRRLEWKKYESGRFIVLPDGQQVILQNVVYTEYYNHVVTIYNKKGEDIRTRISQSELERRLLEYPYFCCCSKGVVVNLYEVVRHSGNAFLMSNGKTVYLSRRKEREAADALTNFHFKRIREEMKR